MVHHWRNHGVVVAVAVDGNRGLVDPLDRVAVVGVDDHLDDSVEVFVLLVPFALGYYCWAMLDSLCSCQFYDRMALSSIHLHNFDVRSDIPGLLGRLSKRVSVSNRVVVQDIDK